MTFPVPNTTNTPVEVKYPDAEAKVADPPVSLDLDKLEREGGSPTPFSVFLGGKRYLFSDPQEVDWQELVLALRNPVVFFHKILPPEDHQTFFTTRLPTWKMNALMQAYMTHYGIPLPPESSALSL